MPDGSGQARRRVLVTGGCGFIGSNLVDLILRTRDDLDVTNLDALTYAADPACLDHWKGDDRYTFVQGDITEPATVAPLVRAADVVLHLAAETHVDRSIADATPFMRVNALGTQVLLDAARDAWLGEKRASSDDRRFVLVSTDEVYGSLPLDEPARRFTEASPLDPRSPYAASKAAADMLARAYHVTHGLPVIVARSANNLGPRQYPEKIIPLFVRELLAGRDAPLYGDGRNVRDWIHVDDHAGALLALADRGRPGEVYNIGANNERSNLELTRLILERLGLPESRIAFVADRPGHDRRYALDSTKLRDELGWRPTRSEWPGALFETVDWYRERFG